MRGRRWVVAALLTLVVAASPPGTATTPRAPIVEVELAVDGPPDLAVQRTMSVHVRAIAEGVDPPPLTFEVAMPQGFAATDPVAWSVDLAPGEERSFTARITATDAGYWILGVRYPDPDQQPRYPGEAATSLDAVAFRSLFALAGHQVSAWAPSFEDFLGEEPGEAATIAPPPGTYAALYHGTLRYRLCGPDGIVVDHGLAVVDPLGEGTVLQTWTGLTLPVEQPDGSRLATPAPSDPAACRQRTSDGATNDVLGLGVPENTTARLGLFAAYRYPYVAAEGALPASGNHETGGRPLLVCSLRLENPADGPLRIDEDGDCTYGPLPAGEPGAVEDKAPESGTSASGPSRGAPGLALAGLALGLLAPRLLRRRR